MVKGKSSADVVWNVLTAVFLLFVFIIMAYPFLYVFNYSISDGSIANGTLLLLPKGVNFNSYFVLLKNSDVLHAIFISVARSLIGPVLQLVVTGMAAYALSSPDLACGKMLRTVFILPMYLTAGIIPNYIFMKAYGLTNNFLVYILPNICSSFNLILLKTYIEALPRSLTEAVYLDGGNDMQAYWKVIFPICMPVNAAVTLFSVIQQWNSLMDTEMYCAMTKKLHTLQYFLFSTLATKTDIETLRSGLSTVTPQGMKMAITIITIVPIICVYPIMQRYFVSGIMIGSVKA